MSKIQKSLQMFGIIFIIALLMKMLVESLSGRDLFPIEAVLVVSIVLTLIFLPVGWSFVTIFSDALLGNDPSYQAMRASGRSPFWDFLPWVRQTQSSTLPWPEPQYTTFVPPPHWRYQCPNCGARVEKQVDVCWNCNYGADGDSTLYHQRMGKTPAPSQPSNPDDWQPIA